MLKENRGKLYEVIAYGDEVDISSIRWLAKKVKTIRNLFATGKV